MPVGDGRRRKITGWCGVGMVGAILINGPLSQLIGRVPSYWSAGAGRRFEAYLSNDRDVDQMVIFFALSNLIFVFGIGFFAGLRTLVSDSGEGDWVRGVMAIGAALFLAGGLLSETLSTGIAVVIRSTPDYRVQTNDVLLLQGLWSTALAQGQVALGVVIAVFSWWAWRARVIPVWLSWLGIVSGLVDLVRPIIATEPPAFIISFQPTFLWIVGVSIVLVAPGLKSSLGPRMGERPEAVAGGGDARLR